MSRTADRSLLLIDELRQAWRRSDLLFAMIDDAWLEQPIPLRHPFVFYLGHLPAFAWNQIGAGALGHGPVDAELDVLFERGIDPLSEEAAEERSIDRWPPIEAILAYRDKVRETVLEACDEVAERDDDVLFENDRIVHVVLEHELMHHETLLYMLHELEPAKKVRPAEAPDLVRGPAPARGTVDVPGGRVTLGADFDSLAFGWDNEFPRLQVEVGDFAIERLPVTVSDFLAFVADAGYRNPRWWSPEDREWLERRGAEHPHGWVAEDRGFALRTMFDRVPLDEVGGWPAIVSGAEAAAYARWRGGRLPSEAELHRAAYGTSSGSERPYPWGDEPPRPEHGNFGLRHFDPVVVGRHPAGKSAFGVDELVGNGWEWTGTAFAPFPGFRPWIRTYPGYSADFFDREHAVLFGGAWPTDERLLRRSFRNWFQRHYPFVFATFRCVFDRATRNRGG